MGCEAVSDACQPWGGLAYPELAHEHPHLAVFEGALDVRSLTK